MAYSAISGTRSCAIRQAITLLQGVLGELDEVDDTNDGEDDVKANAAAEEQKQSNPAKESLLAYINNNKQEVKS